jgi:predicted ATP-grasp superfamily ATP-dependent carboligase
MVEAAPKQLLIAGVSTRALAVSAARAGFRVTAIDAFGDMDLRRIAQVITVQPTSSARYSPMAAAAAADTVKGGLVSYTSNFENHPAAVDRLERGKTLLGNAAPVLRRVRDPLTLMRALRERGFPVPETRATAPAGRQSRGWWMLKPRRSGGGHGTAFWRQTQAVPRTHYLQERVDGLPGSVMFAADGQRVMVLGLIRQIVGDVALGASGFRYCGSLLGPAAKLFPGQPALLERAMALAAAVTEEFGLRGLNGIDFIASGGVPYPIEVNPRYSSSMDLVERVSRLSIFEVHALACQGSLPHGPGQPKKVHGKAIVFARRNLVTGETQSWLDDTSFADIPHPGEAIQRGHPICTVFAGGDAVESCYGELLRGGQEVHRATELRKRRAA